MLWWFWGYIRFFGCGRWRFRSYSGSLWQTPQSNQRSGPRRSAPRWGSGSLRSGTHPGASPPVCCAAPPLDVFDFVERSLRSHPRMNPSTQPAEGAGTSRAVLELTLIVLSGGRREAGGGSGKREAGSERRKAESGKQRVESGERRAGGKRGPLDRSHAPRGNAARDAPRSILECLRMTRVYRLPPRSFDRSHALRGNAARDAPRSMFECLRMARVYRLPPRSFDRSHALRGNAARDAPRSISSVCKWLGCTVCCGRAFGLVGRGGPLVDPPQKGTARPLSGAL
jgi:hypothetical protein